MNTYSKMTALSASFPAAGTKGSTSGLDRQTSQTDDAKPRRCGATLSRTCSSASQRFRGADGGGSSGMSAVVRRAFSMRRPSSSLAEGYWRIHDSTGDEDLQQDGDVVDEQQQQQQTTSGARKSKKKGRILKAWKKLFGF